MADLTPAEKAQKKQDDDITSKKDALKKQGTQIEDYSKLLGAKIPGAGGMTLKDFEDKWIPSFETGYTKATPDTTDTPYGKDYSKRPKVKIIDRDASTPSP